MEGEDTTHGLIGNNFFYSNETPDKSGFNGTLSFRDLFSHPFSDPVNRAIIIVSYSIVFLACIIGNVLVLFVIARNKRMRTRTNVFLANLAVADLCVGILCIFPNMLKYLLLRWFLGKAMCKVFQFVIGMNLTASMLLLEVVAVERYVAINHSLKARRFFTRKNMYFAQFAVWIVSFVYNVPVFIMYDLHEFHLQDDNTYTYSFCYPDEKYQLPNNALADYDTVTFVIWYVLPLTVMTLMYASMVNTLRKSTLPNYIMPTLSSNRHVSASLCSTSQVGKNTITSGKNVLIATMTLRANNKKRSVQSTTITATAFESSPSKHTKIPSDLELLRIYNRHSLSKTDQKFILQQRDLFKSPDLKPRVQDSAPSPRSSRSSSNNSEHDPFSSNSNHQDGQLRENALPTIPCEEQENSNNSDKHSGECHETPLTLQAHNSNSSCGSIPRATTSTKSCRYRLTSLRASRRRVIRLLIIVLTLFAVLMLPHHLVLLLTSFHKSLGFGSLTGPLCDLAMFLNSAVNPVLYSLFSQTFRRNLKEAMHRCKCNQQQSKKKRKAFHHPVRRTGNIVDNPFMV